MAVRVRTWGVELSLGTWLVSLTSVALVLATAIVVGLTWRPAAAVQRAARQPASPAQTPASAAVLLPAPLDSAAIEAKSPDSRSSQEVLILAGIAAERKRQGAVRLGELLRKNPDALRSRVTTSELRNLVDDPLTAREALAAIASLPGPRGADLLYEVWTSTPGRTEATELAKSLLASQDLRVKMSEPLAAALALRTVESCAGTGILLERAVSVGDRRSLSPLMKWKRKPLCGSSSKQDCCTKDQRDAVDAALEAVMKRPAPKPFESP